MDVRNCHLRKAFSTFQEKTLTAIASPSNSTVWVLNAVCQGASCVPMYQTQNFNMSCPDGIRSVPVNVVMHCDCQ
ncbi:hypothetical protein EMCRGX_G019405 [Ephydatia muelleri]